MSLSSRLRYYARDAVDEWRHSPGVNVLATGTLAAVLFVAALFLLVFDNASEHLREFRRNLRVEIYLADDVAPEQVARLRAALSNTNGVSRVDYVGKDEALARFRTWFPELGDVPVEIGANPLPASLEVYLAGDSGAVAVARSIEASWSGSPGVEEVRFDIDWIGRVESLLTLARAVGAVIGLATFGAVVFVIASVLRLAVYARRDEIEIMMLVGASPGFVRGPFLFAGWIQGMVASGLALAAVEGIRRGLAAHGAREGIALASFLTARPLDVVAVGMVSATGIVVSLTGAWLAVRRDLGAGLLR